MSFIALTLNIKWYYGIMIGKETTLKQYQQKDFRKIVLTIKEQKIGKMNKMDYFKLINNNLNEYKPVNKCISLQIVLQLNKINTFIHTHLVFFFFLIKIHILHKQICLKNTFYIDFKTKNQVSCFAVCKLFIFHLSKCNQCHI